ncbi:MAG: TrkA family potassium uptake protein [Gammaproteobacteria bacterium]|nr:TrkA family potassium uptake protein [Gammaproteobacteria bacterium]NIR98851.1 TrkA family potassium uptake protein [Gammaproteobacteria bacterium]NIT63972.1 TrkA family potassium uptake protein [Gammaproteobacteria bacterium]NIV19132.1 TrkA family potassium uptake protein [Gammaproteobacteria bacterium]NIX10301.1 TrkA family potassium uptake protein [Gammaproteobacteria bacterium]
MRAVFVGAGSLTVMTVPILLRRGHETVIIERDRPRIEALSQELDCGFLHGDGSKPALLSEADPERTDVLFCLTGNDQSNILASLVGRSLGFKRVVTKIEDPEYEHICLELGLKDAIVPAATIGRYLADMFEGQDLLELSATIKEEARVFSFVARDEDAVAVSELNLPAQSRAMFLYRDGAFTLAEEDTRLKPGDEVVVITHSKNLPKLQERWSGRPAESPGAVPERKL